MKTVRWLTAYVVGSIVVAFALANGAAWLVTRSQCAGCGDASAGAAYGLMFVGTLALALVVGLVILAVRLGLWADEPPR